ncbi:MAG: aldo/keto reductase [Elusimicrobiota bacterium]|jgi:aryl-alcohol dehydrogenase-like predicted oxidoreductase
MRLKDSQQPITLGHSELKVSPLCLGTMTFGTAWGWGCGETTARQILGRYLDAGGNFIDTAEVYTDGASEEMLGRFLAEDGKRQRVVLATKFSLHAAAGEADNRGSLRERITRSLEGSLRRLRTGHIDIYWLHSYDTLAPAQEVMSVLDSLVQSGKVRYVGLSNVPAWYSARAQTLAQWRGWNKLCALQLEYSLIERNLEREHVPAARELGMSICAWSPLAGGFLSGKYNPDGRRLAGSGRLKTIQDHGNKFCPRFSADDWRVLATVEDIARDLQRPAAQIAINWVTRQPQIGSTIIGATQFAQMGDILGALEFDIPPEHARRLDAVSRPAGTDPYTLFAPEPRRTMSGEVAVRETVPVG